MIYDKIKYVKRLFTGKKFQFQKEKEIMHFKFLGK